MSRRESSELLHEIAAQPAATSSDAELPADELLLAYTAGELEGDEQRRIEEILASSKGARARLLELREVTPSGPSPELRQRVLADIPLPRPRRVRWTTVAAVAAVLLAVFGLRILQPGSLPQDLQYQVQAFGVAEDRIELPTAENPQAYPETVLRLEVAPSRAAEQDVDFALYRLDGDTLRRLGVSDGLTVHVERGAAELQGRAADLLGKEPGHHSLWIAIARPNELPDHVALVAGSSPHLDLAGEGDDRRIYEQTFELLARP